MWKKTNEKRDVKEDKWEKGERKGKKKVKSKIIKYKKVAVLAVKKVPYGYRRCVEHSILETDHLEGNFILTILI